MAKKSPKTKTSSRPRAALGKRKQPDYIQPDLHPEDLAKRLVRARPKKKKARRGRMKILRTERYKGHDIRIETTYKITVDGKAVSGHLDVTNSGHVHYHPLPNRSASSAIDMVRTIINSFPDDFPSKTGKRIAAKRKKKASARKAKPRKRRHKTRKKARKKAGKKTSSSYRTRRKGGR